MAVYKDKSRGTWYTSFLYVDWTGKRCRKLKRGFATKKEAQEWEMHFKLQKANSLDMSFADFCKLYEQDVKPKLRYNTWCSKQHVIETKLLPYFKDLVMRDICPRDIIQWQNVMREASKKDGEAYAGTYLKTMQAPSIFNHAVRFYQLPKNPVRIAGAMGQSTADEMLFWTKEEYMKFIPTKANKTYSYMAFELLYWCGIRLGELRALTPADIDFETNTLSITKSYQRIKALSLLLREFIEMPELLGFDGDIRNEIHVDEGEYIFVEVSFESSEKTYCYICDDKLIQEYDEVLVPVGQDNIEKIAIVESVDVHTEYDAPYPVEKCKHVIKRMV